MRSVANLLLLALSLAVPAAAQTAGDSLRIERLAAAGKLWANIRYFHPWLASRAIDWDAALVAAIPKIQAARDAGEYAAAVQSMLEKLGDPVTRVIRESPPRAAPAGGENPEWSLSTADGILVVTIPRADVPDAQRRLIAVGGKLIKSRGVVFDLRSPAGEEGSRGSLSWLFSSTALESHLSSTPVVGPEHRSRMYSGFPPEGGTTSGGYYSGWQTSDGHRLSPASGAKDVPAVFLINAGSDLPAAALALHSAGKARIVADGPVSDAVAVRRHRFPLADGVEAEFRRSDLVYPDGSVGLEPDAVATGEAALEAALALARDPKPAARRPKPPPAAAPRAERAYAEMKYPPVEYRLMAAFRIWVVFHYFFAYRDLMGEDWDAVLKEFLPRLEAAATALEYSQAVAEMVTRVHDSHAFINSAVLSEYLGVAPTPVRARLIEGLPVITTTVDPAATEQAGVEIGDVILKIDGEEAQARIRRYGRYIASSTAQALAAFVLRGFLNGPEGQEAVLLLRDRRGREKEVKLPRSRGYSAKMRDQRRGEVLQILPGNVGYADLDRLETSQVDRMFDMFQQTKAIIFDMRGYPRGTAWPIGARLAAKESTGAARFRRPMVMDPARPGQDASSYHTFVQPLPPSNKPRYPGQTVMLIDERAISQAEHTGLFFEAANGTKFVGSHTMGANGDITRFHVPGGILIGFSGHDVRHADGRQLQRVGLIPDVEVRPTLDGIRAGRDEVLEKALEWLGVKGPVSGVGEAR